MIASKCSIFLAAVLLLVATASAFQTPRPESYTSRSATFSPFTKLFEGKNDGVVELADDEEETADAADAAAATAAAATASDTAPIAPFLSQGEISDEAVDLSDPKQARVMTYIILSLLPVLFLLPLMLGSRDLIPLDMLPPVQMN